MEIEHSQSVHQNYGMACVTTSEMLEHCLYLKESKNILGSPLTLAELKIELERKTNSFSVYFLA